MLDEVDQLESKNQDVLYTVFEWPALSASRLALVGIANTLDLTDRVLPRLQVPVQYQNTSSTRPGGDSQHPGPHRQGATQATGTGTLPQYLNYPPCPPPASPWWG